MAYVALAILTVSPVIYTQLLQGSVNIFNYNEKLSLELKKKWDELYEIEADYGKLEKLEKEMVSQKKEINVHQKNDIPSELLLKIEKLEESIKGVKEIIKNLKEELESMGQLKQHFEGQYISIVNNIYANFRIKIVMTTFLLFLQLISLSLLYLVKPQVIVFIILLSFGLIFIIIEGIVKLAEAIKEFYLIKFINVALNNF